jgi:Leucine-rich repeat (LRR) protein
MRDLGVGLKFLISLSVNDCGLNELDGIGMLTNLKILSARDNSIEDVTALALHENIEVNSINIILKLQLICIYSIFDL